MNKKIKIYSLQILVCLFSLSAFANQETDKKKFLVIINSSNSIKSLDRQFLSDIYFKRVSHWVNDGTITPVDLKPDSPVRREFSEAILSRSVSGIRNYWQQLIFSGRDVPPPELSDDNEVIQFVRNNRGAIGYVSRLPENNGVKIIDIK